MSFSLEHFHLHFPEDVLVSGEQIYDQNTIFSFEEIERNLWAFELRDPNPVEVEILISPSKVLKYSCECDIFKKQKSCRHIVASLYKLRLFKTKSLKSGATVIRSAPKKLNIANILNQINEKELKNFIKSYAKRDKRFSTALKANFARSIELENNEEKYERILHGIVRPATSSDYRISINTIRQLLNVAEQFDAQFDDAISLKQFKEAFYILKAIFSKVSYVYHWAGPDNENLKKWYLHFHRKYVDFLEDKLAPSLKKELLNFGTDLLGRSYYHLPDASQNLLFILWEIESSDAFRNKLIELLNEKFENQKLHYKEEEYLWVTNQYFFNEGIVNEKKFKMQLGSQAVYRICDALLDMRLHEGLINFIEKFRVKDFIRDKYLIKKYLEVLKRKEEQETLIEEGLKYLYHFKEVEYYKILVSAYPSRKEEIYQRITQKLEITKTSKNERLHLQLLGLEQDRKGLMKVILDSNTPFVYLFKYAEVFETGENELSSFIKSLLDKYLSSYFGNESAEKLRSVFFFLKQNVYKDEIKQLKDYIQANYQDRQNLIQVANAF